jgi:Raf kinase inhibitor-like YbhB/YbcL family protein
MKITSPAFEEGALIPGKYTCDALDISPPLEWSEGPEGTQTYALINDDPDAPVGTWVHWVIYNLPVNVNELPEDVPSMEVLENGGKQGKNDFGRIGYGGPCPPGGTHRYFFKLYAVDMELEVKAGLTKKELLNLLEGHVLAECQLMGRYRRG